MSRRSTPTEAGELNRDVSERSGREVNSGTSAEFGQGIGRSENLEGGEMKNRDRENSGIGSERLNENEQSRRPSSGQFGQTGRSSGSGDMSGSSKNVDRGSSEISSDRDVSDRSNRDDSSEGRH
jgi:hypothetical protein